MIEIAFDKNDNDEFLNSVRPVVSIQNEQMRSFEEYRQKAKQILDLYSGEQIILIRNSSKDFSSNLLAVALFVQSCLTETKTECVVFKVSEYEKSLAAYKPYVALTIALKYAIRLYNQPVKETFKEIANMSYLGINIKRDYAQNLICMTIDGNEDGIHFETNTLENAIIAASTFKALSLIGTNQKHSAQILISDTFEDVDINNIINIVTANVIKKINMVNLCG